MTVYLVHNPSKPEATGLCFQAAGILAARQVVLPPEPEPQCSASARAFAPAAGIGACRGAGYSGRRRHHPARGQSLLALERPCLSTWAAPVLATCEVDEMQEKLTLLAQDNSGWTRAPQRPRWQRRGAFADRFERCGDLQGPAGTDH